MTINATLRPGPKSSAKALHAGGCYWVTFTDGEYGGTVVFRLESFAHAKAMADAFNNPPETE